MQLNPYTMECRVIAKMPYKDNERLTFLQQSVFLDPPLSSPSRISKSHPSFGHCFTCRIPLHRGKFDRPFGHFSLNFSLHESYIKRSKKCFTLTFFDEILLYT